MASYELILVKGYVVNSLVSQTYRFHLGRVLVQMVFVSIGARLIPGLSYEREVRSFLSKKEYAKPVIDIGAQSGFFSILFARMAPLVISVEPIPENLRLIRHLLRLFRIKNVRVLNAVVSDRDGITSFYIGQGGRNGSLGVITDRTLQITTRSLPSLISNFDGIGLIKVDAEGAEVSILKGAQEVMERIDSWIIEVHDKNDLPFISRTLAKNRYNISMLDDAHLLAEKTREPRWDDVTQASP